MKEFFLIFKDGKYLTSREKFTDNFNLAYLFENKDDAEKIAQKMNGIVKVYKPGKWLVVKDGLYLGYNNKFVEDIKNAYVFHKITAQQYARELNGEAVETL